MKYIVDIFFKDKNGNIIIGQSPNPPLIIAIAFYIIRYLNFESISVVGFNVAILYWAILELTQGVNFFRKLLGLVVISSIFFNFLVNII